MIYPIKKPNQIFRKLYNNQKINFYYTKLLIWLPYVKTKGFRNDTETQSQKAKTSKTVKPFFTTVCVCEGCQFYLNNSLF